MSIEDIKVELKVKQTKENRVVMYWSYVYKI